MESKKPGIPKNASNGRFGISRRAFIKLSGTAFAVLAATRLFKRPALGSLNSPEELPEGEGVITEKWFSTSCLNCGTRCAIRVRVVNGRAVKITGNPLSKIAEGENCARAHIGLQVLYDPGRITSPLKRTNSSKGRGIDPQWQSLSWEQALGEVSEQLKSLRGGGQPERLLVFTGLNAVSDDDVIRRFAEAYGTPNVINGDGFDNEADKAGEWMADGHYTQSAYDLAHTNYILSFGTGILESYKPLSRSLRMWGKIRRERSNRVKSVVIDPRYSVTALRSDEWLPIVPGTDGALAMAIANVIISEGLYDADFVGKWTGGFNEYKELALKHYRPEFMSVTTGIPTETIRRIAREFATAKPAIAWRGRGATSWPDGSYTSYAIFCLNALVGSIDVPGGVIYQENPAYRDLPAPAEDDTAKTGNAKRAIDLRLSGQFPTARVVTNQAATSIVNGSPYPAAVAIGFNSNFNMSAPGAPSWDEAMKKIPYYVHIAPFVSEMAEYADIVLPSTMFLEQWGYDHSPPGSGFAEVRLKQPTVEPMIGTLSLADIVFEISKRIGGTVGQSFSGIGDSAEGFVRYRTGTLAPWDKLINEGVWVGPDYKYHKYDSVFNTPSKKFEFRSGNLEAALLSKGQKPDTLALLPHHTVAAFIGDSVTYPLLLSTYEPLLNVENGSQNYPWAQELFLVEHGRGWGNFAEMNTRTARDLGIRDGDMVWVESPTGKIKTRARVFDGIRPGVVSIARGQGHYAYGKWAKGIGVNPNEIIGVDYDRLSGQSAFFNTRVNVYRA